MKKVIFAFIVLAAGTGAFYFFYWRPQQLKAQAAAAPPPTAKVERGPVKQSISATGRVVAKLDVDIKCKASGVIIKLPFDISASVKQGELLLELDPVDEQRQVDLAEVSLTSSSARLVEAKQNLMITEKKIGTDRIRAEAGLLSSQAHADRARIKAGRLKDAMEKQAASQEDYDTAETEAVQAAAEVQIAKAQVEEIKQEEDALEVKRQEVKLAEAQVKSDQITLANSKQRLSDTKVMAPMDGVVVARAVQTGQIISSAISNVGGGTTILTLSDFSQIFALGSVDESDYGTVELDQNVVITADAYKGKTFHGKVVRKAKRGTSVSNVVTFEVKIEILGDKKSLLLPEMTTNLEIIAAKRDNALLVPLDALVRKQGQKQGERTVTVQKPDGGTEEREVKTGINDGVKMEIEEGLKEGEVIVVKKGEGDSKWRGGDQRPPGFNPGQMMGGGGGGRGR